MIMAVKSLFQIVVGKLFPQSDALDEAKRQACVLLPEQVLAQYVITGSLDQTSYTEAEDPFQVVQGLCDQVDAKFIALLARFSHEKGHTEDIPGRRAMCKRLCDTTHGKPDKLKGKK